VRYTVEMASGGMMYVQSFVKTGSDIQVLLRLLPGQCKRFQFG
jgi:hypothetical protein